VLRFIGVTRQEFETIANIAAEMHHAAKRLSLRSKRFSVNMVSAINNQGLLRFMIYESIMIARVLIKFMRRLIKDAGRKVFLILDNLKVHHAKPVKAWLERHQDKIVIFYLPSYSPELNPDEYLNCDLKTGLRSSSHAPSQKRT